MPEPAEFHDPMPELIETIIRTMGGATTTGIARRLLTVTDALDQIEGILREEERSLTSAAIESTTVEALARLTAAFDVLAKARDKARRSFESGGSRAPATGTQAHGRTLAPSLDAYLNSLRTLLPEPVDVRSAAIDEAQDFCESLAIIATVMATLADLLTGSISDAAQQVAESIGKPLAAAGMELSLTAAKENIRGTFPPKLAEQLAAQQVRAAVLGHVSPGTLELRITAFALRLTGAALCLASGRPVTRCPCYSDLVSDTGTSILGLPRPE